MQSPVYAKLAPVRRRQRWLFTLRAAIVGLLVAALAGVVLGLGRWLLHWPVLPWAGTVTLLTGPVLGLLVGLLWPRSWHAAAAAVDRHCNLKDRATTALAFVSKPSATVFHDLQVRDAVQHLAGVEPGRVVPFRWQKYVPSALGGLAAALVAAALLVWPLGPRAVEASPPQPLDYAVVEAEKLQEALKDLEQNRKEEAKELEKLVQEVYQKAEEMKQPGLDQRDVLVKLSEMEATIAAQKAQYNTGLVDGSLQSLGAALSSATATDGAGKSLTEGKYDKAAEELEKLEELELDPKDAKALEEKLKQVANEMGDVGLGQLSEAVSELAEGIKGGGKAQMKKATKTLAKEVRAQGVRKKVNNALNALAENVKEAKSNSQQNGGPLGKRPEKSLNPSSTWGRSTSGNVLGEKTKLLSQHSLEQVTGNPGDGPSDFETTHSAEGRQQAARQYKETYEKFRKMSEAVLDGEPIPLGHRQTIRKYFELIHPQNVEMEKKEEPKAPH